MASIWVLGAWFALLGGALSLWATPVARAAFPGRNGQVAYAFEDEVEEDTWSPLGIEAIRPGHPPRRSLLFTHDPLVRSGCIESPSYSADGKLIAFDSSWGTPLCEPYPVPPEPLPLTKNLFVMSARGGEVRQVTSEANVLDSDPGFSPNGDQIVFSRQLGGRTQIYTIDIDGSNLRRLTNEPPSSFGQAGHRDLSPRYAPDGKHIVFDSKSGIEEINSDGGGRKLLVPSRGRYRVAEADFSPNGGLITFVKATGWKAWIYISKANGKAARRLSASATLAGGSHCFHSACAASPIFSPDGRWVLFVVREPERSKLEAVSVNGGRRARARPIVSRDFDIVRPTWQPLP